MKTMSLFLLVTISMASCNNSKVVCPGAGQNSASDMALFDEDGQPISKKKKKKKTSKKNDYGLINKSNPNTKKKR